MGEKPMEYVGASSHLLRNYSAAFETQAKNDHIISCLALNQKFEEQNDYVVNCQSTNRN